MTNPKNQLPSNSKALSAALWYLSRKSRTVLELRKKLEYREFDVEEIETAIVKLIDINFLDDAKYAKNFIERSTRAKGKSRIKRELILKGVPKDIVDAEIELIDQDQSLESVFELAHKKYKSLNNLTKEKIYNRLISFLIRRGFSYDEAKKAYDDCVKSTDVHVQTHR